MNTYEIMFLFDPSFGANWDAVEGEIKRLMDRAGAEVLLTKRLEERRLHFEIKGRKRGLYAVTFFKASGERIGGLERDARLSESILRILILRADGLTEEKMQAVTLAGTGHEHRRHGDSDRSATSATERPGKPPAPTAEPAAPDAALVGSGSKEGSPPKTEA